MSLPTFFSLSPLEPYVNSYDPYAPNAPFAHARCQNFGGVVLHYPAWRLEHQHLLDRVIMGYNAVPLANQDLWTPLPYQCGVSSIYFRGYNVSTENQYLLIFELHQLQYETYAQFFVNSDLVGTVQVRGIEKHSILLHCLGDGIPVQVWVRLASPQLYATMAFRGVDCYLL